MKLNKLFEGWEELGIEDPNLNDSSENLNDQERPSLGQVLFGKEVFPDYYIIRTSKDTWKILPIQDTHEDIIGALSSDYYHNFSVEQVLSRPSLQFEDFSLIYDPDEWDIEWVHGWELTKDMLLNLGIIR